MAISYHVDEARRRIYSRAEDLITFEDLRDHMHSDVGSEVASYAEVFDCTGATTDLTVDQVRILAEERKKIAEQQEPAATAVIATNDVVFGMFRMFDILTSQVRPLRVFRDVRSAENWLDSINYEEQTD